MTQTARPDFLSKMKPNSNGADASTHERDRVVVRLSRGPGKPIEIRTSQLTPSLLAELARLGEFEDDEY